MSESHYTKEDCLTLLTEKYHVLQEQGEHRYPKRSDFADREVMAIKAFLGPWPRALESAGIKPKRSEDRLQKNHEKRARAKRARRLAEKNKQ